MLGGPSLRLCIPIERPSIPPWIGWGGKDTGWLSTVYWFSILKISWVIHTINFIFAIPVSSQWVPGQSLDLRLIFFLRWCRKWNSETSSILPVLWDFSHELHVDPSVASITVHEEDDDLVDEVLLLERDEVLLAAIRSFHLLFVYFFGHN